MNKRDWVTSLASLVVLGLVASGLSGCSKSPEEKLAQANTTFLADVNAANLEWSPDTPMNITKIEYGHAVCKARHNGLDDEQLALGLVQVDNGPFGSNQSAERFVSLAEKDLCSHITDWSSEN